MKKLQVNLQSKALCVKHGWILSSTWQNCICFPGTLTSLSPLCLLSVSVSDPCPNSNNCYPQPFRIAISSSRPTGPNYKTKSMNFTWLVRKMRLWLKNILVPHCGLKWRIPKISPRRLHTRANSQKNSNNCSTLHINYTSHAADAEEAVILF